MKVRSSGIALLLLCVVALHHLYVVRHGGSIHDPTATELIFSLVAVLTGIAGFAMTLVGPSLFQPSEWPPRDHH